MGMIGKNRKTSIKSVNTGTVKVCFTEWLRLV